RDRVELPRIPLEIVELDLPALVQMEAPAIPTDRPEVGFEAAFVDGLGEEAVRRRVPLRNRRPLGGAEERDPLAPRRNGKAELLGRRPEAVDAPAWPRATPVG